MVRKNGVSKRQIAGPDELARHHDEPPIDCLRVSTAIVIPQQVAFS